METLPRNRLDDGERKDAVVRPPRWLDQASAGGEVFGA